MLEKLMNLLSGVNLAGAAAPKKSVEEIAIEVINGRWGSGDTRKTALTKAGYNYDAVQSKVNEFAKTMRTRIEAMKPWFDACKTQAEWAYNSRYNWGKWKPRNIAMSKEWGTCITNPNVVAMRCKLIKEGGNYITSTGGRNDSKSTQDKFWNNSVKAMNSINSNYWRAIKYPNKKLKDLIATGAVVPGDIIGFMGHTTMYAGKNSKGDLLFNNAGHAAGITGEKIGSNRPVINQVVNKYGDRLVYGVFSVRTFGVITSCVGGKITPTDLYMAGQDAKITITPDTGKTIKSIKVDGKVVSNTTTYTFSKISAHHKVEVICDGAPAPKKKSVDEIAREVIAGKWSKGATRKERLTNAGYNYEEVQKRVGEILAKQKSTYTGELPTLRLKKTNTEVIADTIKWAKWIATDNRFHYGYTSPDKKINAHHNGCYFCGTNTDKGARSKKGIVDYQFTYCCNPFVGAAWAHGGCVPKSIELCQKGNSWSFNAGHGYDSSPLFTNLKHPAKSSLKPGDVLCRNTHVALYIGDGKIVEAGAGDDNKRNSAKWNESIRIKTLSDSNYANFPRVHRFNSSVNADIIMRHGEVSKRVALWQAFLDWYFDGKVGAADGYFGDNTLKWTKKFQEEVIGKGQGDGLCGNKTFEAAKKVKK